MEAKREVWTWKDSKRFDKDIGGSLVTGQVRIELISEEVKH